MSNKDFITKQKIIDLLLELRMSFLDEDELHRMSGEKLLKKLHFCHEFLQKEHKELTHKMKSVKDILFNSYQILQ